MNEGYWPSSREHCAVCPFKDIESPRQNVTALYEKQMVRIFGDALESDAPDPEPNYAALNTPQLKRHLAARRCAQMIADGLCDQQSRPNLRVVE